VTRCDIEAARSGFCSEPFGTAKLNTPPHPETMKKDHPARTQPRRPNGLSFFRTFRFSGHRFANHRTSRRQVLELPDGEADMSRKSKITRGLRMGKWMDSTMWHLEHEAYNAAVSLRRVVLVNPLHPDYAFRVLGIVPRKL
jgi:hypothetical protein